jgi:hypothetical protein
MGQCQENATDLHRQRDAGKQKRQAGIAESLAYETEQREQVIEVVQYLNQSFHEAGSADYGQQRAVLLGIAGIRLRVIQSSVIGLLRMGDSPVKQFPALPSGFILERNHWRFSFRAFV